MAGVLTDKPQGRTVAQLPRPIPEMLKLHDLWVRTTGREGEVCDLSDVDLRGGPSLDGMHLTGLVARNTVFYGVSMRGVSLQGARLQGADLRGCRMDGADLRGANLSGARLNFADLRDADASPLMLPGNRPYPTILDNASLRRADLRGAKLSQANLTGADLTEAQLYDTDLEGAVTQGAKMPATAAAPRDELSRSGRRVLRELDLAINAIWRLGQNMVVGWSHEGSTVFLCVVPTLKVFEAAATVPQVFQGQRHMPSTPFQNLCKDLQARPNRVSLPLQVGDGREELSPAIIDNLIRRYSVTRTPHRAVMLFDIVGFSLASSIEQVAQLNSLEYSINGATKRLRQVGTELELARSTVGDGFYVWNRSTGLQADIATYIALILILADNARARREVQSGFVPLLRACFTIGPHYSYHQVEGTSPRGFEYIVGEVTITLARLISKALTNQMIVGAFRRPLDNVPGRELDTPMFMTQAAAAMAKLGPGDGRLSADRASLVPDRRRAEGRALRCRRLQDQGQTRPSARVLQCQCRPGRRSRHAHGARHEARRARPVRGGAFPLRPDRRADGEDVRADARDRTGGIAVSRSAEAAARTGPCPTWRAWPPHKTPPIQPAGRDRRSHRSAPRRSRQHSIRPPPAQPPAPPPANWPCSSPAARCRAARDRRHPRTAPSSRFCTWATGRATAARRSR